MLQAPSSCQFIGIRVPLPEHVDLTGEAGQSNFPDTDGNGIIHGPQTVDHGAADFAVSGSEQHTFAEYLAHCHVDLPFSIAETRSSQDRHMQNVGVPDPVDTVFP